MTGNTIIEGAAGLAAVMDQWRNGTRPSGRFRDPPFARLSAALADQRTSVMDRWVLLRHALRYESLRIGYARSEVLPAPSASLSAEVGLTAVGRGRDLWELSAYPWAPLWLDDGTRAVDEAAMRAAPRRFHGQLSPRADPFLRELGRETYRSLAQQAAIRAVLSMPAGASLIVDLPTGEGKSTAFQVIASAGFAASRAGQAPGLVVVVVPTITLALDHERTCGGCEEKPLAYVGGRDMRNSIIRDAINAGTQRLLFAAPEAVVQSLRAPLSQAANVGTLGAVVIDEAHLVDGWGTGFRTEFQSLAGVLNAWRVNTPAAGIFRTIFLSATLGEASIQTLQDLFSPNSIIPILSGASVRPEPEYWLAAPTDQFSRRRRVEEALRHLPRPAILYVTRVSDAEWWSDHLRKQGYSRLALVHGGTSAETREQVLKGWSEGQIDIVVATSAFGLGIDYPHVRTVIHACLPETLDRFYQEIGRGGRDGCASISLLVPQFDDAHVARSLSAKKVITVDRGLERWRAMFNHPTTLCEGHPTYVVPLDIAPGYDLADIDLIGERSTDWNLRTLVLMARAGLIRLLGACVRNLEFPGAPQQFERIEVTDEGHLENTTWQTRVESTRTEIAEQGNRAFGLLTRFATGKECPATLVGQLYSAPDRQMALICSGCRVCRENPARRLPDGSVAYRRSPWPLQGSLAPILDGIWGEPRYAIVTYPLATPASRVLRDFVDVLRRLDTYGLRIWVEVGRVADWIHAAAERALSGKPWVTLASDSWTPLVWPDGARAIVCALDKVPNATILASGTSKSPRIVLIVEGSPDPTQSTREFVSIVTAPVYTFHAFLAAALQ
jgi:ATP-dependent DNA helicase RecQ